MTISIGYKLPNAGFLVFDGSNPHEVTSDEVFGGKKVAVFAMPGAFTRGCSGVHLPSVIASADQLREKGVDDIAVLSVNDPFVMRAWGEASGAIAVGIRMLADADGTFTGALGLSFSAPAIGLLDRARRFSMLVDDGQVTLLNIEPDTAIACSTGEALLEQI